MKDRYRPIGLLHICPLFGLTRQAYYQYFREQQRTEMLFEMIIKQVLKIRKDHKAMDTRKLCTKLQPFLL